MDFQGLLRLAAERQAPDVHVQALAATMLRVAGQVRFVETEPLTNEETRSFIASIAPQDQRADLDAAATEALRRPTSPEALSTAMPGIRRPGT